MGSDWASLDLFDVEAVSGHARATLHMGWVWGLRDSLDVWAGYEGSGWWPFSVQAVIVLSARMFRGGLSGAVYALSPVHISVVRNKIKSHSMVQLFASRKLYGRLVKLGTWVFYHTSFSVMDLMCAFIRALI